MNTRTLTALTLLLVAATPLSAQMADGSAQGVRGLYQTVRGYIVAAAEQVLEETYAYQPTPDVRTFGQLIGHVTNAGYLFCAPVLGEQAPQRGNAEEITSKAELVAALKASFEYCDRAYAAGADRMNASLEFFGQPHTGLSVLAFNMGHDFEHYGNIVTYMRLNGMVPPSSQGGGL